jgi:hypothetical protein
MSSTIFWISARMATHFRSQTADVAAAAPLRKRLRSPPLLAVVDRYAGA